MSIHIFTEGMQEATNFESEGMTFTCKPNALRSCWRCGKRHRAKTMTVQVFYDSIRFWCKDSNCAKKPRKRRKSAALKANQEKKS